MTTETLGLACEDGEGIDGIGMGTTVGGVGATGPSVEDMIEIA